MNDTRSDEHFGCERVMRVLLDQLAARNVSVLAMSPAGSEWRNNHGFLAALAKCDIIIINGEGTLHHGKAAAERLLRITNHPLSKNKPIALINALYMHNPADWGQYLKSLSILAARDRRSALELEFHSQKRAYSVFDLSLFEYSDDVPKIERRGVIIGDSVCRETRDFLAETASLSNNAVFVPITRGIKASKLKRNGRRSLVRGLESKLMLWNFQRKYPNSIFCKNETEYTSRLKKSQLHITGRFHAVCLSILTKTPFLALSSNTSKIEELLDDLQIGQSRLIKKDMVRAALAEPQKFAFTDEEKRKMTLALLRNNEITARLFDDIARVA